MRSLRGRGRARAFSNRGVSRITSLLLLCLTLCVVVLISEENDHVEHPALGPTRNVLLRTAQLARKFIRSQATSQEMGASSLQTRPRTELGYHELSLARRDTMMARPVSNANALQQLHDDRVSTRAAKKSAWTSVGIARATLWSHRPFRLALHQTGKSAILPRPYVPFVASWIRQNNIAHHNIDPGVGDKPVVLEHSSHFSRSATGNIVAQDTHSDWTYTFWTDTRNRAFVKRHFRSHLRMYDALPHAVQRADIIRYMILYEYGGVYADLDFENVRPLAPLLLRWMPRAGVLFGQEPYAHARLLMDKAHVACNALLASKARHPFWLLLLSMIKESVARGESDPVSSTGPRMLQRAYQRWRMEFGIWEARDPGVAVRMLEPEVFFPKLAIWNRANIYDGPCANWHLRGKSTAKVKRADKMRLCAEIESVGWERYANGHLFTNETVAVHHWFFYWGMSRKTYGSRAGRAWDFSRVLSLALNRSIVINASKFAPPHRRPTATSRAVAQEPKHWSGTHVNDAHIIPAITDECLLDKEKFCSGVQPGNHRTHKCLEKARLDGKVSLACAESPTFKYHGTDQALTQASEAINYKWPSWRAQPRKPFPPLNFSSMIAGVMRRHNRTGWRGETCSIPRVVHVTWKSDQIQSVFAPYLHSWLRLNPGWTLRLHTDADNRRLVQERYPQLLQQFDGYGSNIQRADMIRYVILFEFGGIYADLDFECLRPLAPLLRDRSLLLADEPAAHTHVLQHQEHMVCNAIMGSCRGHPFWLSVLNLTRARALDIGARSDPESVLESTGPKLLTDAVFASDAKRDYHVQVLPSVSLFPHFDENNENLRLKCEEGALNARCESLGTKACAARRRTCIDLRHKNYKNGILTNASYATHHWSHTWLQQVWDTCTVPFRQIVAGNWSSALTKCKMREQLLESNSAWQSGSNMHAADWSHVESASWDEPAWDGIPAISEECVPDKQKLCGQVQPGNHRTHKCMEKARAAGQLSEICVKSSTFN